ncbi:hypothetical protein [Marinivivus vitaminiproducens]|uniref:hypothetical protein n=1 Tax=Marinivivus vitaminiproducens TaxID=3035935 RepID=UPI0027AA5B46|nr:hypothetical protein P4R82_02805 [Geminicoccaceae bacterium SCSIO 64248]
MATTTHRIALLASVGLLGVTLAACGSDNSSSRTTVPSSTSGSTMSTDPMAGASSNNPMPNEVSPQNTTPGTRGLGSEADESGSDSGSSGGSM